MIFFRSADYLIIWMSCLLIQTVRLRVVGPGALRPRAKDQPTISAIFRADLVPGDLPEMTSPVGTRLTPTFANVPP